MGKVLFFCPALIAGGLERVLSVLSGALASHFDEVTYITWHDFPVFYDIDKRVNVVCAEKEIGSHSAWKRTKWLRRYVKVENPDVLISFSTPFNMISLVALMGAGIKVVVSERNDPAHFRWGCIAKIFRNLLYLKADGLLVQTETSKEHLWTPLAKRAVVIPNPILMDDHYIGSAIHSEMKPLIVSASRFVPQKKNDMIIRAFAEFLKCHPDYQLIIYGEGREKSRLEDLVSALGLNGKVVLPGAVPDVWDKMKCASLFVMASEYEGMPNALMEAMSLGLPCISTRVCGAIDIIKDGENGVLVNVNDEKALLNAFLLIADNKGMREKLGRNAIHVAEEYDFSKIVSQWIGYINNFL